VSEVAFASQPIVEVKDLSGATLTGDNSTMVTLSLASGPAGATLTCTGGLTKQVSAGAATYAGCQIDKAGTYRLRATTTAFAPAISDELTIVAGPPDHVAFLKQPANGALTPPEVEFVVAIVDAAGNVQVTDDTSTLTLGVDSGSGNITCDAPGVTHTVTDGVATFLCTFDAADTYTVEALANPVTPVATTLSNSFTVTQYADFTVEPGDGTGGSPLNPQPTVTLHEFDGTVLSGDNSSVVTLAIASGPAGATLTCTNGLSRTVVAGVAGFSGCRIDKAGTYTLSAASPTFAAAISSEVEVEVGPPARLVFTIQPGDGSAGEPLSPQPQVTIQDLGGNTVVDDTDPITLSILGGTGTAGARIECPPAATVAGVVDFDGCAIDRSGTGYQLVATDAIEDLTVTSTTFDVDFVEPLRIFGSDAIATALWVSASEYPVDGSAGAVVLARSDFYSDALAGGPLAVSVHAPLLITAGTPESSEIDPRVLSEIERVLSPGKTVYVLGGPLALAPAIDDTLEDAGYDVVRVAGQNLFSTATAIADQLGNPATVFEATGLNFADALSAVPAAVQVGGAILLTDGPVQAPETAEYLASHPASTRYAIGGPLAAAGADPEAIAVWGQDLYDTSAAVGATFFSSASTFGAATGASFEDALSGGVFMATGDRLGPIVLVAPGVPLPPSIEQYLRDNVWGTRGFVFGGPLAISESVYDAIVAAIST
jgi:hypothetical protein